MANKASLRSTKKQIIDDIIKLMLEANGVYFDATDENDFSYAKKTVNFCKSLLNDTDF